MSTHLAKFFTGRKTLQFFCGGFTGLEPWTNFVERTNCHECIEAFRYRSHADGTEYRAALPGSPGVLTLEQCVQYWHKRWESTSEGSIEQKLALDHLNAAMVAYDAARAVDYSVAPLPGGVRNVLRTLDDGSKWMMEFVPVAGSTDEQVISQAISASHNFVRCPRSKAA